MAARSWLYVPGDRPELIEKAAQRGADALILDLEDAVAPAGKARAREVVADHLRRAPDDGVPRWVRVNRTSLAEDVEAVAGRGLTGIVLAKAEAEGARELDAMLSLAESEAGLPKGAVAVVGLVETAGALMKLGELTKSPRVRQLAIGEADMAAELGVHPGDHDSELDPIRLQVVVASAAGGLLPPMGPVPTNFLDLEALHRSTLRLLRLGFRSRALIHPAQIDVVNAAFTPDVEEIARARAVVTAFARAKAAGSGVHSDDGHMVDLAIVRGARDVLARAQLHRPKDSAPSDT